MARELVKLNSDVTVYCNCENEGEYDGVRYLDISKVPENNEFYHILISSRSILPYVPIEFKDTIINNYGERHDPSYYLPLTSNCNHRVLWLHDICCLGDEWLEPLLVDGIVDEIFTLSDWHTHYITERSQNDIPRPYEVLKRKIWQTRNGINSYHKEVNIYEKDRNLMVYNSSVHKGMIPLLKQCWPLIKERIPDAKLKVIGGYYLGAENRGDEQEELFRKLYEEHHGKDGVEFTGVITQKEISDILTQASLMVYPAAYPETFGISTLEALNYNVPVVTCRFGALEEVATESCSYLIDYSINHDETQISRFVDMVCKAYNEDIELQQKMHNCNALKPWITWDTVAMQWKKHFYNILNIPMDPKENQRAKEISQAIVRLFNRRHLNREDVLATTNDSNEHRMIVISPVYNAEKYIANCINSVAAQNYHNYKHYIINDMSTDNTKMKALEAINNLPEYLKGKFVFIDNKEKYYAIGNQVEAIKKYASKDDVVILLDGDDWLANNSDIFNRINNEYNTGALMTYGSCRSLQYNVDFITEAYPDHVHRENAYRDYYLSWIMPVTHLRTFKKELFDHISEESFKDKDGKYLRAGADTALFYPLIELAPKETIRPIYEVLCIYNDNNALNDYKVNSEEQTETVKYVQSLPRYNKLNSTIKVLVAVPTAKSIEVETFKSIYRLEKPDNCVVDLECFHSYNIDMGRNNIADHAIKHGYDYVLFVDSDIILPKDALIKMLNQDTDIISGIYIQKRLDANITEVFNVTDYSRYTEEEVMGSGVLEISACGFGCVLIKTKVLEDVGYPQFEYHGSLIWEECTSEDIDFCNKARAKGYKIYADCSIKCGHVGSCVYRL